MSDYDELKWRDYKEMYSAAFAIVIHPIATCKGICKTIFGHDLPPGSSLETRVGTFVVRSIVILISVVFFGFMLFAGPVIVLILLYGLIRWLT